jgi:hypothetical protein
MPFRPISWEDMTIKHMDDDFWYALDLSVDPPMLIANPFVDDMEELTYIFQEEEDARLWAHVVSKTPAHQDHKLDVNSDKFRDLIQDIGEEMGRYKFAAISHDEAPKLFEHYEV